MLRLWRHFSPRRQKQFIWVMALVLISAFAEVVSLGAILPFIGILIAPERVYSHTLVSSFVQELGIHSADQLILPLTVIFALTALLAGGIRLFVTWATTRLVYAGGADLSREVYRRTLHQPYQVHISRNSSEVISGMTAKIHSVIFQLMMPFMILVSSTVLLISITVAMFAVKPIVSLVVTGMFGAVYFLISWFSRSILFRNSQIISHHETQVLKALQEGLGGIRDVLLDGTQKTYWNIYSEADHAMRRAQASNSILGSSPRYVMEAVGIVMIAFLAYALSLQAGGVASALPLLAALALSAQRILPALQQGYMSWTTISGCETSLAAVLELLDQPISDELLGPVPEAMPIQYSIRFESVCFRYSREGQQVLQNLNLTIPKGARVGFVGSTGSGKSTTIDLLMGLLRPDSGRLLVDEQPVIGNRVQAWQRSIAHVPQSIFLADATLAENIAFGLPYKDIDMERVKRAARQAHIADFIENSPNGYDAFVGERGIRLSGGQRQRIGIARALYKQASVLVFDEATSALDNATEQSVMDAIEGLHREFTILLIAHRLSTVKRCDIIVELVLGHVVAQGTYEELVRSSKSFREMARLAT